MRVRIQSMIDLLISHVLYDLILIIIEVRF